MTTNNNIFKFIDGMGSNKGFNENYVIKSMYKNIEIRTWKLNEKKIKFSYNKRGYIVSKGKNIVILKYDNNNEIEYDDLYNLTTKEKCIVREIIELYMLLFENWKCHQSIMW